MNVLADCDCNATTEIESATERVEGGQALGAGVQYGSRCQVTPELRARAEEHPRAPLSGEMKENRCHYAQHRRRS